VKNFFEIIVDTRQPFLKIQFAAYDRIGNNPELHPKKRNRATAQEVLLPSINLLPSLPDNPPSGNTRHLPPSRPARRPMERCRVCDSKIIKMNRICKTVILVWIAIFAFSISSALAEGTNDVIPPFMAEGSVSTEIFASNGSTSVFQNEGNFLFSYSNGVWEIQVSPKNTELGNIKGIDPKKFRKTIINCKRVPDGIRYFVTRAIVDTNQFVGSVPQAIVEPIPFPPPDKTTLLACWFSLCPKPDLPIINSTQVHRFLLVNLFKNPDNVGNYSKAYLEPEHLFLSKFSITNDGTMFVSETEKIKLDPPFENGFEELDYEVVESTKFNGFSFPSETVLYGFAPKINAKDRYDVYQRAVTHLKVEKVEFESVANMKPDFITPQKLVALDRRASNLPDGQSAP
jgi:hypothetical protein